MSQPTALERVQAAYGDALPDWIAAVAKACDATNQTTVAATLGYSRSAVNLLVNGKYDRDLVEIERAVRERVMMTRVECPVRGEISSAVCRSNQALPYSNANQDRVAHYRACRRGCPHSSLTPGVRP